MVVAVVESVIGPSVGKQEAEAELLCAEQRRVRPQVGFKRDGIELAATSRQAATYVVKSCDTESYSDRKMEYQRIIEIHHSGNFLAEWSHFSRGHIPVRAIGDFSY